MFKKKYQHKQKLYFSCLGLGGGEEGCATSVHCSKLTFMGEGTKIWRTAARAERDLRLLNACNAFISGL